MYLALSSKLSSPDVLPRILGRGIALARLLRQAYPQHVGRLQSDGDLVGAQEGQGGDGHVGQVDGRHLRVRMARFLREFPSMSNVYDESLKEVVAFI